MARSRSGLRSRLGSLSRFLILSPGPRGVDGRHIVYRKKHHIRIAASPRARTGLAMAMMSVFVRNSSMSKTRPLSRVASIGASLCDLEWGREKFKTCAPLMCLNYGTKYQSPSKSSAGRWPAVRLSFKVSTMVSLEDEHELANRRMGSGTFLWQSHVAAV